MSDLPEFTLLKSLVKDPRNFREDREEMFHNIKAKLQKDPALFVSLYRLSPQQFDKLLKLIKPHLPLLVRYPGLDLSITLRYLCSKDDIDKYSLLFRVINQDRVLLIPVVCRAISIGVRPLVTSFLDEQYLVQSARSFNKYWGFPNCVGAIDGRRIVCQTPGTGETERYELHLLVVCDAYSRFIEFRFSDKTREPVQRVFLRSKFLRFVERARVETQPEMKCRIPFVFVGGHLDFSKKAVMRAFHGNIVDEGQAIFNYQLARAMTAADTAFGILLNRWEIFQSRLIGDIAVVSTYVTCLILLHNWLINQDKELPPTLKIYMPRCVFHDGDEEGIYVEGCWAKNSTTKSVQRFVSGMNRIGMTYGGMNTRQDFVDYFVKEDTDVPSQPESSRKGEGQDMETKSTEQQNNEEQNKTGKQNPKDSSCNIF